MTYPINSFSNAYASGIFDGSAAARTAILARQSEDNWHHAEAAEKLRSTEQKNTDTMSGAATADFAFEWRKEGAHVTLQQPKTTSTQAIFDTSIWRTTRKSPPYGSTRR